MLIYHLGDEQLVLWWSQSKDVISPHQHDDDDDDNNNNNNKDCSVEEMRYIHPVTSEIVRIGSLLNCAV
jgi:hypothetical protein